MVMVMRVRLLSLSSAKGSASACAVFVILDVLFLLLSPLVTGSVVAAALGIGCYVWWCMLQVVTPPEAATGEGKLCTGRNRARNT